MDARVDGQMNVDRRRGGRLDRKHAVRKMGMQTETMEYASKAAVPKEWGISQSPLSFISEPVTASESGQLIELTDGFESYNITFSFENASDQHIGFYSLPKGL